MFKENRHEMWQINLAISLKKKMRQSKYVSETITIASLLYYYRMIKWEWIVCLKYLNGEFIASICQGFFVILEKIGSVKREKLKLIQKHYSCF